MEDEEIKMMEELGLEYLSGSLPSWFYQVWLTMQTVAPYKDEDHEAVRPLGLRNSLIKVFHKEPMVQNKTELREFLEPVQLGLSKAGAALLTRSVSGILHSFRNFICFRLDLKNAFNEMSRRAIMDVIAEEPSISHLETFVAAISAPIVALETGGKRWGESGDGVAQGDPPSGDLFSVGLQPDLVVLNRDCRVGGGQAIAGHDDVFAQGPPQVVIPAVMKFAAAIWERCHLRLQWNKSRIFSWDGVLPDGAPEGVEIAGKEISNIFHAGFDCYGVPMGTNEFVHSELMKSAKNIVADAERTKQVLAVNKQAQWAALRLSISQRFQYLCQHVHPSLCEPVAAWLDVHLWKMLENITGFNIPRGHRGQEGDMVITVPVEGLAGKSFQEWCVRLPIKLYGWGLRSLQETCIPAYLGTLETAIPRMMEISPAMAPTWGGEECWGSGASIETRWRTVLGSGSAEGDEMKRAWELLTREALESASWLNREVESVFKVALPGLGSGKVTGETRGAIVSAREKT